MSEWKKVRLDHIGRVVTGKTPKTSVSDFWNGDVPFVTPGDIQSSKHISNTARYVTKEGLSSVKGAAIPRGAICVSCIGVLGYTAITERECITNQQINSLIVNNEFDVDFIYYALRNSWNAFKNMEGFSSVVSILNKSTFSEIELSLPPLPTQRKIAAVLSSLDDKIENNRKICANLEAQAQAIFKNFDLVKDEVQFTSLINILSGGTPKTSEPSYWGGDIPFFSPKDVGEPFAIHTERTITKDGLDNCNSGFYLKDTTFVTARGTVGKVCMAGVPMAMNQSCFALTSDVIDPLLVYYYTKASIDSLRSKANGSVFDAITIAEFETERIARLKESEERKFVNIVRPMFDKILSLSIESRALAALRDALLPKLMSGEIDVEKVEVA